ncbi:MAG: CCA tRNA nucleotidyltransferase [Nanohaloarchaea archaeon SW_4_43_9]|nr:MAG: CCA tRNA nucleotidyltransferase [Nanohaloarchaea archaeon SW_4_43_9]
MEWKRLREKIIEGTYPREQELEELRQKYREISDFIEREFGMSTHFAGSASRGTCMKNDGDLDIFILFQEETDDLELENRGLEIGKETFQQFGGDFEVDYAEHPYTKGEIDGYEVEIVPCYGTNPENIKSSVDRTPHHSKWVKENLTEEERKDTVILKNFLDSMDLYGSSLKTQGFSGYLCEILVNHYGGFHELVKSVADWEDEKLIDPENQHNGELSERLEKKFSDEPLKVIDPVDEERNVASVLSLENYSRFIYLCWRFRQNPGMGFFKDEERNYSEFRIKQELKRRSDFLLLEFGSIEEVDDIIYPQMRKTMRRLNNELEKKEFRIYESGFYVDQKTKIFFELDRELPEMREMKGPKVFHSEEHLSEFTSKYENVFIKKDRMFAKTERKFTDAKRFLEAFLSDDLEGKGIPGNVAEKLENYSFKDPLESDSEWLNYLGEKLHLQYEGENE